MTKDSTGSNKPIGENRKGPVFGNRGHVTISQPTKPSDRPSPKPPTSQKK